jgi:Flp pilus assembly protein TadG
MLSRPCNGLRKLARETRGGIAVIFAISLPVLLGTLGLASDYAMMMKVETDLQKAADAAAMAGAREIPLARRDAIQVKSAAQSFAAFALTGDSAATAENLAASQLTVEASVVDNFSGVKVDIEESWTPFFAHFVQSGITPVRVTATARFVGSNNLCVLGLAKTNRGVYLDRDARLTGNSCGVFANSTDADGLRVDSGAKLKASVICSAGGSDVSGTATVDPRPITDCPAIADPLASRPAPAFGGCDHNALQIKDQNKTLDPGVYCGGLIITGTSIVTLNPGTYVIKDGMLQVSGSATMGGDGVAFFITGKSAGKINFAANTHIQLTAPDGGPMAGLLFFEDRGLTVKLKHRITSNDARKLIGTIYFPVGDLIVDAKEAVADQSAYTAIIVQHLELNMGPNLVLNSNYDLTDIPVPEGIKGVKQVVLTQ